MESFMNSKSNIQNHYRHYTTTGDSIGAVVFATSVTSAPANLASGVLGDWQEGGGSEEGLLLV